MPFVSSILPLPRKIDDTPRLGRRLAKQVDALRGLARLAHIEPERVGSSVAARRLRPVPLVAEEQAKEALPQWASGMAAASAIARSVAVAPFEAAVAPPHFRHALPVGARGPLQRPPLRPGEQAEVAQAVDHLVVERPDAVGHRQRDANHAPEVEAGRLADLPAIAHDVDARAQPDAQRLVQAQRAQAAREVARHPIGFRGGERGRERAGDSRG